MHTEQWDLLITDIELPGMSGLELLERVRELAPGLPVAVLTGHASVDYAVSALRGAAAEFLQKPVEPAGPVAKAAEPDRGGPGGAGEHRETVLAIGAHPDDVEIGAGGDPGGARGGRRRAGDPHPVPRRVGGDMAQRARESQEAADVLGARLYLRDLEDTRIPEGNPTIAMIEEVVAEFEPTIVYTHSVHDLHQDHRSVHRAAMVACRRVEPGLLLSSRRRPPSTTVPRTSSPSMTTSAASSRSSTRSAPRPASATTWSRS